MTLKTVMFDVQKVRNDFPILSKSVHGKQLIYLDNAATSQKPNSVIKAIADYYANHNANIHRGIHTLSEEATQMYIDARQRLAHFIGTDDAHELVFVRNATEAINLVARTWAEKTISEGDYILVTQMEHHSNLVPWQILTAQKKANLLVCAVTQDGELDLDDFKNKLSYKPKLVSMVQVSNFLGVINPVADLTRLAHEAGAKVLIDAAQSVPHMRVDVQKLGIDFFAFSGHKMMGPMGIGCLWVRRSILESMPPFLYGGGMIDEVFFDKASFAGLPDIYDAGTPNVEGAIGLSAAVDYLSDLGIEKVAAHESELVSYALGRLQEIRRLRLFGPIDHAKRGGVIAFTMKEAHAHDVAQVLDRQFGIAVRSGHHCVMPLHMAYEVPATTRISFYAYNTQDEIDVLIEALYVIQKTFGG